MSKAQLSGNATVARSLLSPYMPPDRVSGMVSALASIWSQGEKYYGTDIPHVLRVTVNGATAFAYECDDTSSSGLQYTASGKVVPGSQGIQDLNLITKLLLSNGRWLVQNQSVVDEPCKA